KTVIVAFHAGNMVTVSERLSKSLPENVPVTLAVDNDASQTGMKKALQAAAYFGGRAQVVEPEFTMTQIRQYQQENGMDEQGRPKLPSDFNDLHHLAGIEAVREKMEAAFRRPEAAPAVAPEVGQPRPAAASAMTDEEWAAVVAEEARLSGYSAPPPAEPPHQAAQTEAASVLQEQEMNSNEHDAVGTEAAAEKPSENAALSENTIEYATLRRGKEPEPYQGVDPDHVYGSGRTTTQTATGESERVFYEGDFRHYEMFDPRTNIQYLRNTPQEIQADLDKAGDIYGYEGLTHDGELVPFSKTADGWESPLPGNAPEQTSEPDQAEKTDGVPEPEAATVKKPVTDLNYRIPPESIESRYVVAGGKYLSAANHTTVMFTDAGKKISTAKTDMQTINDMLEVAKEKGWDSIKISGSQEFKAMMYVAAESRGIRTTGYRPKPEDLALLERMRQERSLNAIEPQPERAPAVEPKVEKVTPAPYPGDKRKKPSETQAGAAAKTAAAAEVGERIVDVGTAHYRHNPNEQLSPYIVLEREGKERTVWGVDIPDAMARSGAEVGDRIHLHKLGKQPVEIEVAVRDENG
ncbi:LPD7 domain-containing protein, partial [Neisseria dumasiana]